MWLHSHRPFLVQWLIFGLALLLLGSLSAYDLYLERGAFWSREQERLVAVARVIEVNVERNLDSANQVLMDLRKDSSGGSANPRLNERLKTLTDAMPSVRTIVIQNAAGTVVAASRPELLGKQFDERAYFTAPRQHPDLDVLYVAPPLRTSLGAFAIVVGRIIPGAKGEFAGVITATLDPEYFDPFLDSLRYASDMVVSLRHGDGMVFMVAPHGQDENPSAGAALSPGEERILVRHNIQPASLRMDKPLEVAVSRRLDQVYLPWLHHVDAQFGLFAFAALTFALALGAYQRRQKLFVVKEAEAAAALAANERFMRTVTDNMPGIVGYWTRELRCGFANSAYFEWFGKTAEQMRGIHIMDLMGEDLYRQNEPNIRAALRGEFQSFERTVIKADGSTGHALVHYVPDVDGEEVKGFFVQVTDISQLKRTELALAESEAKLKTIIDTEPECVKLLARDGTLLQMNRAGLDMIEADSEEQVVGTNIVSVVAPDYRAAFRALNERIGQGETGKLEFEIVGLKGRRRWLETHAVPLRDAGAQIIGLLGVTRDITERKKAEHELERLSQTDSLTGLANRRHFLTLAEQELSRRLRYGGPLSVFMMDIDLFKNINDTYGHQTGDLVLQRLGALCRDTLRDIDCVGRIGGEEFAVVLPQTDGAHALDVAERLRQTIARAEVALAQGLPLRFTVSIGVTTLVAANVNIDTLLGQADSALYQAKRAGRNRVCVYPHPEY